MTRRIPRRGPAARIPDPGLMTPGDVARLFRRSTKTIGRWRATGRIPRNVYTILPTGHYRYHRTAIEALHAAETEIDNLIPANPQQPAEETP